MPDQPINPLVDLSPEQAEIILEQWLGAARRCTGVRRMTGGCVHTVVEVSFEHEASPVVFKVAHEPNHGGIEGEYEVLRYFRQHTAFPVPEPLFCDISGERLPYSYLVMQRLPGAHLGDGAVALTRQGRDDLEREMAEAVAELHGHRREQGFGPLRAEPRGKWTDYFGELIERDYRESEKTGLLTDATLRRARGLIDLIPEVLERGVQPTLIHGDIWATNIMVDLANGARLTGFLDPGGIFGDPEFELAYLQIWQTVGAPFLDVYSDEHPVERDYPLRRSFYWLRTLLQHVRAFKTPYYARAATELIEELSSTLGS